MRCAASEICTPSQTGRPRVTRTPPATGGRLSCPSATVYRAIMVAPPSQTARTGLSHHIAIDGLAHTRDRTTSRERMGPRPDEATQPLCPLTESIAVADCPPGSPAGTSAARPSRSIARTAGSCGGCGASASAGYARELQPAGSGSLCLALEQLKKKLAAEGLLDPQEATVAILRRVALVTSPTGAPR